MFTPYLLEHNDKHKVWFVSDTHWNHDRPFILSKRGYKTIQEHDEGLIKIWNQRVGADDTVIHLGDFIVGAGRDADYLGDHLLKTLNGQKIFLWGNHNSYVKTLFKRLVQEQYGKDNVEVYPIATTEFGKSVTFMGNNLLCKIRTPKFTQFVYGSHFAHRIWIDMHKGSRGLWSVSGHSHGSDKESQPEFLQSKRLDVGIENFGGPIDFDQLAEIMNKKQADKIDMHDSATSPSF